MTKAERLKITYIILVSLIILLSLYLFLRQRDGINYAIPKLSNSVDVDEIQIERSGKSIKIIYFGATWQIMPEGYRADPDSMDRLLEVITDLELSELVSVTGNYNRYNLDNPNLIRVSALKGGKITREFDLGKLSPTYDHTFIKLAGDDRVFQTPGDLIRLFSRAKEDFRDKTVLSFSKDTISRMEARSQSGAITLVKKAGEDPSSTGVEWQTNDGDAREAGPIESMLTTLSNLKAYSFDADAMAQGNPIFELTLVGGKTYTFTVFERQDNYYPARTSQSQYPFTLFYAITENIMGVFFEDENE